MFNLFRDTENLVEEESSKFEDKTKEVKILFQDEAKFGRINDIKRCWAPSGMRPLIRHQAIREYSYVYGAGSTA